MNIKFSKDSNIVNLCETIFVTLLAGITLVMTYIVVTNVTNRSINPLSSIPITTLQIIIAVTIQNRLSMSGKPKSEYNTDNTKSIYKHSRKIIFVSYLLSVVCYIIDVILTQVFIDNDVIRFIYTLPCFIMLLNLLYLCTSIHIISAMIIFIRNTVSKELMLLVLVLFIGLALILINRI